VACFKEAHVELAREVLRKEKTEGLPLELCVGKTPEIIRLAHSCLAVSGSVSLELLHACKPAVVLYRSTAPLILAYYLLRNVKRITLVNLLADEMLYPEHVASRCPSGKMAEEVLHWLEDESAYRSLCDKLADLKGRVAMPGACARAAEVILAGVRQRLAA
jgi:lipid-A-disaccharide synthase